MSPEEHYAKAEELLELAANDEYPERHFQDRDWLTARAQAHATLALFTPTVSINVQNPKSADELAERVVPNPEHPYFVWEQGYQAALTDNDAGVDGTRGNAYTSNPYSLGESEPDPAAVPAEEETKAEVPDVLWATLGEVLERWKKGGEGTELYPDQVHPLIQRGYIAPSNGPWTKFKPTIAGEKAFAASSPVVPAPTETGPWQTWQEVPEGVKYRSSKRFSGAVWFNQDHNRYASTSDGERHLSGVDDGKMNTHLAPFVASGEEEA